MTNLGDCTAGALEAPARQFPPAPDIRDVAAAAGVSTATVSRALRGLPRVSNATRQRILAAAASLGYVASAAASELARGRGGPPSRSRGSIVIVNGSFSGPGKPEVHRVPLPSQIQQLVQPTASAHGLIARVTTCSEAGILDTVRAAALSAVGIVIGLGVLRVASKELLEALAGAPVPTVEVRLDHVVEPSACTVLISGAGTHGYKLAVDYLGTMAMRGSIN